MLDYLGIIEKYRPRIVVWENVVGVLSTNGGRDFGTFLGRLVKLRYGVAYRVLDSRWFGIPQRRRRVFVVGYLGNWRRAAAVLFDTTSLQRNFTTCRSAEQGATRGFVRGFKEGGGSGEVICMATGQAGAEMGIGVSTTLTCAHEQPIVVPPLTCRPYGDNLSKEGMLVVHGTQDPIIQTETAFPLGRNNGQENCIILGLPRRLMPVEYERLQGFRDGFTKIPFGKSTAADTLRYKALGNSMSIPVVSWIGRRIEMVDKIT